MTIGRLAPAYQGRLLLPVLGKVASTRYTDRVAIRLVSGQSAEDYARRADNLAHGFGAVTCRVRSAKPGRLVLEFVRRDALTAHHPRAADPGRPGPDAPCRSAAARTARPWTIRLHGTHLLIAGSTGAGKDSVIWGLVRALLPALRDGLVRVLAADPKVMELAYGRAIFDTYGTYAADPEQIAGMLESAVAAMRGPGRAARRDPARPHAQHRAPVRGDHRG